MEQVCLQEGQIVFVPLFQYVMVGEVNASGERIV
jgi:hypothetical protein